MRITTKGQVTIPQAIREKYHFDPYSEIDFKEENGRVFIERASQQPSVVRESPFEYGRGRATIQMTTEEIMRLTRAEIADD